MKKSTKRTIIIVAVVLATIAAGVYVLHPHSYGGVTTRAATCVLEGTTTYKCWCGKSYEEPIEALGHTYEEKERIEPTCTEKGKITSVCTRCNDVYEEPIEREKHGYESSVTKEPTCTEAGEEEYVCKKCGKTVKVELAALGHEYRETASTELDCVTDETHTYTCERCEDEYTETKAVHKGHQWEDTSATLKTCSECGKTKTVSVPLPGGGGSSGGGGMQTIVVVPKGDSYDPNANTKPTPPGVVFY